METITHTNHLTLTIRDTLARFYTDRLSSQVSPRTLEFYQYELTKFRDRLEYSGISNVDEIAPDIIRSHMLELATSRNPGGVHARFRAIRAWLNWIWEEHEIEWRNPIIRVKSPKVKTDPLPGIPIENIMRMVKACNTGLAIRDRALLLCLLDTGARRAEFIALNWDDINFISGDVFIKSGKGGKSRTVFIGKRAKRALGAWKRAAPKHEQAVWTTNTEERLTPNGLREILRRRALSAGVPVPGPHDFRRACLRQMILNGEDAITVCHYAGHTDVRVTLRYVYQTDDDIRKAHARSSPVDNWL